MHSGENTGCKQQHALFGLAPDGVYPATPVTKRAVSSYLTFSPLPGYPGGLFSVALSLGLLPLAVNQHPFPRSPDFPLAHKEPAIARPSDALLCREFNLEMQTESLTR